MRVIDTLMCIAALVGMFGLGILFDSHRIQATCESDDSPTVINGTEYVCLSQRHLQMMRQQRERGA